MLFESRHPWMLLKSMALLVVKSSYNIGEEDPSSYYGIRSEPEWRLRRTKGVHGYGKYLVLAVDGDSRKE